VYRVELMLMPAAEAGWLPHRQRQFSGY